MKPSFEDLQQELKAKGISLSHQRLKILEYLVRHRSHPTADQIFKGLQKEIATLSRTTVYNTLHTLAEVGLIRAVAIETHETRYDITTETHGHFKCEACGMIRDFELDARALASEDLSNFRIFDKNISFKGLCPECLAAAGRADPL